ncbi:MAG TPA: ribonuclease HII [Ignavibacteria bacterium]|nr:ribonuclease HII [Ignavibacteria bacterium]HQY52023.1 ribonuclease HII [Ignavibacteria bacterium]HRA99762.1 ribonuclease HII [Ignavibacteria bacterium]
MIICGIDEAGRGPLAGPVVAASVLFEEGFFIEGVNDSKMLTPAQRENLFPVIIESCIEYSISEIDNNVIDEINILKATMLAMYNCISESKITPDKYFIDGNYFRLPDDHHTKINFETVIKGDSKIFAISCASILAKVHRDILMREFHFIHAEYDFHNNKGYGTKKHIEKVKELGLSSIHRRTFCKNYFV